MKKIFFAFLLLLTPAVVKAQHLERGYRGLVDLEINTGVADFVDDGEYSGYGISTTHGYQFNPYFFLGGGALVKYNKFEDLDDKTNLALYGDIRVNFINTRVSPYIDSRLGYSVTGLEGFYMAHSVGVHVGLKKSYGLNFSLGYCMQVYDYEMPQKYTSETTGMANSFQITAGFEF